LPTKTTFLLVIPLVRQVMKKFNYIHFNLVCSINFFSILLSISIFNCFSKQSEYGRFLTSAHFVTSPPANRSIVFVIPNGSKSLIPAAANFASGGEDR